MYLEGIQRQTKMKAEPNEYFSHEKLKFRKTKKRPFPIAFHLERETRFKLATLSLEG